ncbi:MAG: hypothetical protein ABSB15_24045 [Bryobacteraceae bacterium]
MRRRDLLAALFFTGCSSTPKPVAVTKPAEPVTGLHALYQMYSHARSWAPDIAVLNYASIDISQVKPQHGKAPAWQVVFASEALGLKRAYTFSVYDASVTLRQGMFPDAPTAWTNDHRAFLIAAVRTDTDQAWEAALKHGEEYNRKNPNMPISYTLEMGRNVNDPVWRVIWGEDAAASAYSGLIDASTGEYLGPLF